MRRWSDDDLKKAIYKSLTKRQVIIKLGLKPTSGNYRTIDKYINILGIDTSHFTGRRTDGKTWNIKSLDEIMIENSSYLSTWRLKKRLIKEGILVEKCDVCGIGPEWNGKPMSLQMHHLNGISNDHRLENLQIICPNCHSQTDSFSGRNK